MQLLYIKNKWIRLIELKDFKVTIGNSILYEEHSYDIYNEVKKDIKTKNLNHENLKNICYARAYFMNEMKNSPYIQLNKMELDL